MHRKLSFLLLVSAATAAWVKPNPEPRVSEPVIYSGLCGASAAAPLGSDLFVVAADEANQLSIFSRDQGGPARQVVDLTEALELDWHAPATDIEGAARLGDRVYWITSHSHNHLGREHPNRYRFFATAIQGTNTNLTVSFVGRPYKDLLRDLIAAPALGPFNLQAASLLPPKARGALNIESLCATPDNQLLIGFRNPIPGGAALLVPLKNPVEMLKGQRAEFGSPVQLELNGLGIRDMACWKGEYLIIAGPYDGVGKSRLYSWSGGAAKPKHLREIDLKGLNPEAIVIYPDLGLDRIQLLSDDSTSTRQGGVPCKEVTSAERHFRAVWVKPGLSRVKKH
jgi:hypothetical protein